MSVLFCKDGTAHAALPYARNCSKVGVNFDSVRKET